MVFFVCCVTYRVYKKITSLPLQCIDSSMNIAICPTLSDNITYVAAVSSNRCFMYSLTRINHLRYEISQTGDMHLLQEFIDDNENEVHLVFRNSQSFTVCEWMMVKSTDQYPQEFFLAVGGVLGQIKILDCMKQVVYTVGFCMSTHPRL